MSLDKVEWVASFEAPKSFDIKFFDFAIFNVAYVFANVDIILV